LWDPLRGGHAVSQFRHVCLPESMMCCAGSNGVSTCAETVVIAGMAVADESPHADTVTR
jgi:hypothetical protein